jgi:Zn-dependent protease with chaperone function
MIRLVLFTLMAVMMFGPAGVWLERSTWVRRAPHTAVLLWQAIGINGALAAIGAGLALATAPLHGDLTTGMVQIVGASVTNRPLRVDGLYEACGLTLSSVVLAVLISGLVLTGFRTVAARRRHRILLDLVATKAGGSRAVMLLPDPRASVYCLPGVRPRIVVSAGALRLLDSAQVAAVVEHEKGHLHERHDLAILPFASMIELLDWLPFVARAPGAVASLLEMAADDYAVRRHKRTALASALVTLAGQNIVPSCAFGATSGNMRWRLDRLVAPAPSGSRTTAVLGSVAAALLLVAPFIVVAG